MADFDTAISYTLTWEGGYSNDPDDPGGATNHGVTLRKFIEHHLDLDKDGDIDADDVRICPVSVVKQEVYYNDYWHPYPVFAQLQSQAVATKIFDMTVNMGQVQAFKLVQRALNRFVCVAKSGGLLVVDGQFGPKSIAALNVALDIAGESATLQEICSEQEKFYISLSEKKPVLKKYLKGWLRRAKSIPQ